MPSLQFNFQGKALTLAQPWASAITFAGKDIENRSWQTHYRGPLAIHAGDKFNEDGPSYSTRTTRGGEKRTVLQWINRGRKRYELEPEGDNFIHGHIIAIAMLVDCVERSTSPWFQGKWGWVLRGIVPIEPIPMSGNLGIWNCKFKFRPLKAKGTKKLIVPPKVTQL